MKITDKKICWQGSFLRTIILTYTDPFGKSRNWEAVERVNCSGVVAVIPFTHKKELLLVRQFRPAVNNFVIEFPAGLNDREEDPIEAAKRELIEETGFFSDELILIARGPISSGMSSEMMDVFMAKNAYKAPHKLLEKYRTEQIELLEIIKSPLKGIHQTLERLLQDGDLVDLKVYGFIELAKAHLREEV
ncbi:MAG: NUDIX hydrolase [Thermodesulfovibrionales bacterium]|nr:NUDIX hydrolase [Thermodesulfovibrionales bacterium]